MSNIDCRKVDNGEQNGEDKIVQNFDFKSADWNKTFYILIASLMDNIASKFRKNIALRNPKQA